MKRLGSILLFAGCLACISLSHGQELPDNPWRETQAGPLKPGSRHELHTPSTVAEQEYGPEMQFPAPELKYALPERLNLQSLREAVDPILRERREVRFSMQQRARESVSAIQKSVPKRNTLQVEARVWRVGRMGVNNWSPFLDRALDARTIRFPLPRDSRADKRTPQMKALDKMRHQKR